MDEMNLYHYHMTLNIAKRARLLPIRSYLENKFRTQENFGDNHSSYFTAYRAHYVTKENEDAPHSRNHSGVSDDAPRSEQAIRCRKEKAKEKEKSKGKR